jgi:hypothetical protein
VSAQPIGVSRRHAKRVLGRLEHWYVRS